MNSLPSISDEERRRRLAWRHGFAQPFESVAAVSDALVGLHASDPATVFLSIRARMSSATIADIESALYVRPQVRRLWGMRRTMFVVTPALGSTVYAATTTDVVAREKRRLADVLAQQDIAPNPEAWLRVVEEATLRRLAEVGTATTRDLKSTVEGLDVSLVLQQGNQPPVTISLASRLLMLLAMDGRVIKGRPAGTWRSSQYEWVSLEAWDGGPLEDVDAQSAEADLVARWLRSYGPGNLGDIKWWTGWTLSKTRRTLAAIEAVEVELGEETGFVLPDDLGTTPDPAPWVAFLPGLDPSLMGWKDRRWSLGDLADRLFDRNGNAGPTIWVDGEVVGGWAQRPDGSIAIGILRDPGRDAEMAIAHEADRLADWIGPVGLRFRFASPYEKELRNS